MWMVQRGVNRTQQVLQGLLDDKGVVLCLFSKGVAVGDSNEAEVLAIMEALRIFSRSFQLDSEE